MTSSDHQAMIRRARSLVLSYQGAELLALNYLRKTSCCVSDLDLYLMARFDRWEVEVTDLSDWWPADAVRASLGKLLASAIIVRSGTSEALEDEAFATEFVWGATVGYYHFGIRNSSYMSPSQFTGWMSDHVAKTSPVELYRDDQDDGATLKLPGAGQSELLNVMRRRRSFRGFSDDPLPLDALADCLFAGLGITGFVQGSFGEGYLPLSMTPSGGARNPYEAYVYVRNVRGLARGTYHYNALTHSLRQVNPNDKTSVGDALAGQPWFDEAAALVLLLANFERTMWKYPHPTGYRVVMLEAGHIAQNIILAATDRGLASAPTCAISDRESEALIGASAITHTVMYSIALGQRSRVPTAVDPIQIIRNDAGEAANHDA